MSMLLLNENTQIIGKGTTLLSSQLKDMPNSHPLSQKMKRISLR